MRILCLLVLTFMAGCGATEPKVHIGELEINVELALTDAQRTQGLKYRTALEKDSGMLFVFPKERFARFWMQDTLMDLDAAFIDSQGRILNIKTMSQGTTKTHVSKGKCLYVLEMAGGYFKRQGVQAGQSVELQNILIAQ